MTQDQAEYNTHEPRKVVQEISGFYPLFEALLEKYKDEITPAVFGVAWRYCQMEDGVCRASLRTMASVLNISEATVMRRLETLCNDGYLIDTTPDRRNRPHVYADAGLIVMVSATGVRTETVSHRNSTKSTVSGRNATVSQGNVTVSESQLIKDLNKDSNKESSALDFRNMSIPEARKVPTLKLYADATEYFPGSVLWETVHKTITESGVTFDKLHAAAVEWEMRGYKKENVKGILEWAINGIPGGTKQAAEVKPAINETAIEKTKELVDRKTSGSFVPRPETIGPPILAVRDLAQRKGIRR